MSLLDLRRTTGPDDRGGRIVFEQPVRGGDESGLRAAGNVISFVHNGSLAEDGVDGIRQNQPGLGVASDAVWSAGGRLAVVWHGVLWVGARRWGARRALRRLAEGSQPSWSPTGGVIAADRRGWIVSVDVRSGRMTRLVRGRAPAFSPEEIQVSDHSGVRTVDTSKLPGAGPFLTALTLTGDVLSWNHNGTPRSITLQHSG